MLLGGGVAGGLRACFSQLHFVTSAPLGLMGGPAVGLDAYQLHRHVRLSKIRYCGLRECKAGINNCFEITDQHVHRIICIYKSL